LQGRKEEGIVEKRKTLETQKSQERNKSPFVFFKGLGRMIQN
jgi:hypothetical protein